MYINTEEILRLNVSFFLHKGVRQSTSISLKNALLSFQNGIYRERIEYLQSLIANGKEEEYFIEKGKLPAITFCGEFEGGHAKSNLSRYNSLLIIDIDKLSSDEYDRIKICLSQDDFVFSFWTSPSGNGIKGLIYLLYPYEIFLGDISDYHTHAFRQVKKYFENTHKIDLDISGSDTSRLCFVTSDNDIIIKDQISPFKVDLSDYAKTSDSSSVKNISKTPVKRIPDSELLFSKYFYNPIGKNNPIHKQEILAIIKYLKKKNRSITYCYDNWYRTAFAIANSFSCDLGEKYFLELCRLDGAKHDEISSKKILIYCYENTRGLIKFSTILHFAKEQGYIKSKRDSIEDG